MQFEWDEAKRRANIIKHGVDFVDAPEMFTGLNPMLVKLDTREDYQEDRFIGVGYSKGRIQDYGDNFLRTGSGDNPRHISEKGI